MNQNEYLSDEENEEEQLDIVELDMYGMPIENDEDDDSDEEELEYRRMLNEKLLLKTNNYNDVSNKSSDLNKSIDIKENKTSDIKENKKKALSLKDFHTLIDSKIEASKPKKFVSKRILDKKQSEPSKPTITHSKREFKPKIGYVPYLFSEQYKKRNISDTYKSNDNEYPTLK